jgi:hypothetical protein
VDEVAELLDAVLHGGAGEEQHAFGPLGPARDVPRAQGGGVLDVVGLVDDEHRDADGVGDLQVAQRLERVDGDAAALRPRQRLAGPVGYL